MADFMKTFEGSWSPAFGPAQHSDTAGDLDELLRLILPESAAADTDSSYLSETDDEFWGDPASLLPAGFDPSLLAPAAEWLKPVPQQQPLAKRKYDQYVQQQQLPVQQQQQQRYTSFEFLIPQCERIPTESRFAHSSRPAPVPFSSAALFSAPTRVPVERPAAAAAPTAFAVPAARPPVPAAPLAAPKLVRQHSYKEEEEFPDRDWTPLSPNAKRARVQRYLEKRQKRRQLKRPAAFVSRTVVANRRPRVNGRFVADKTMFVPVTQL
jgi:CCT motif